MKISRHTITNRAQIIRKSIANRTKKATAFIQKYPIRTVTILLIALTVLVIAKEFLPSAEVSETQAETKPLSVEVMTVGENYLNSPISAQVKNRSAITLVAQSAGPVQRISVNEGQQIYTGQTLVQQSSTYSGGNSATVQRQIAQKNVELSESTLNNTVRTVSLAREQADKNRDNTEELRRISEQSLGETRRVIELVEDSVEVLEDELEAELSQPVPNQSAIMATRGQLVQNLSTLNQLRSSVRNLEYTTNKDQEPTRLAELAREQVFATTELQLKSAELSRDISQLQLQVAKIGESATRVSAPFAGTVEKIYVNQGEFVNPGTPVAKITGKKSLYVEILVSPNIAFQVNEEQMATISIGDRTFSAEITSVSQTPTTNQLYEVFITVPTQAEQFLMEGEYVDVALPLYKRAPRSGNAYIPLDAVFVTNTDRYVYVVEDGKAKRQVVETGSIVGTMIEIISGLSDGQQLILDRRVVDGQQITATEYQDEHMPVEERG